MKAFSYVKDIVNFPFSIGDELGFGAQGQVFSIKEYSDKIIKFSIVYDVDPVLEIEKVYNNIYNVYNFVIENNISGIVKIFEFNKLLENTRSTVCGLQKYIVYYS